MARKNRNQERGSTAESVLSNLQNIEGYKNKIQYLDMMYENGKFKKEEEDDVKKSILLAKGKLGLREGYKPTPTNRFVSAHIMKSKKGLDQLQNELIKRSKEINPLWGYGLSGAAKDYQIHALNLAIQRGDIDLAVKLYRESHREKKEHYLYFVGLGNVYSALGQFGSAKEQYLKAKNIAEEGDYAETYRKGRGSMAFVHSSFEEQPPVYNLVLGSYKGELGSTLKDMIEKADSSMKKKILERRVSSVLAIAGLGAGIFLLSSNITGNAIADLSTKTTSFLGIGLLLAGLGAGFFWSKSKK